MVLSSPGVVFAGEALDISSVIAKRLRVLQQAFFARSRVIVRSERRFLDVEDRGHPEGRWQAGEIPVRLAAVYAALLGAAGSLAFFAWPRCGNSRGLRTSCCGLSLAYPQARSSVLDVMSISRASCCGRSPGSSSGGEAISPGL